MVTTAVTADSVVFGYDGKELKVLLIKRGQEKDASTTAYVGEWALPGGFLDVGQDETIAQMVKEQGEALKKILEKMSESD